MGHRSLTNKQLAARLIRAAQAGESAMAYCRRRKWAYEAVYARLNRSGDWARVMAAKYAAKAAANTGEAEASER